MNGNRALVIGALLLLSVCLRPASGTDAAAEPIVYFDLSELLKVDLNDARQRRLLWDETQLVTALEGLVNRDRPRLFIRYLPDPDDFWWGQMIQPGGWLAGRQIVRVASLEELLARFRDAYAGAVVWDERVPATANLASTVAGCDGLLPLRFDPQADSLYQRLFAAAPNPLPVKVRLLKDDGTPLFTGKGEIPGTRTASSGSAKCDAYLWLIANYLQTGKTNPECLGFYLDAYWLNSWKASKPENSELCNQDFVIARRGLVFDLDVWDDEAPVDDPGQHPGTDAATLRQILRAAYAGFHGNGVIDVAGFVPWAYKYTDSVSSGWTAGGHHQPVPSEWEYAKIISCFNGYMDADALSAMSNASFYQHYPLARSYPQNAKPTQESLTAQGVLDARGRIVPRTYVSFYVGDYDSAAWLYHALPAMWRDPARGRVPLSWGFNPNLSERFPLGMAWARATRTSQDWFVAGDSGAGYLNPGYLTSPRPESNLPTGLPAWEQHCTPLYKQWDISLTGFVVDGFARGLSTAGWDAYARFSPDGIVNQRVPAQGVYQGMPHLPICAFLNGTPAEAAHKILELSAGALPRFTVFRTVLKTPTWHAQVGQELQRVADDKVKVVDLYSLLWLVRKSETEAAGRPASPPQAASAPALLRH